MKFVGPMLALALLAFGQTLIVPSAHGQEAASQGEYLARVANCVACHSVAGGEPFAGGLKMAVPKVGTIYTTNITPDAETGIGSYTFEDFDAAMRQGIAKDGHYLYPAMPYPSYAKLSKQDMQALYDYFMHEVKPVKQQNKNNETSGFLSKRWLLAIWNFLFLDDDPYEAVARQSAEWNRGAYLVQGPGHCGACHTPRGMLFQEKGLDGDDSDFLSGALLDHWSAPALNGDINSGLGRWTDADITDFLSRGKNRFGAAFGTMVEVVNSSTQFLQQSDLQAMAVYLKSLPANKEKSAQPYAYDDSTHKQLASMDFTRRGAQPYFEFCSTCHGQNANGSGTKDLRFMKPDTHAAFTDIVLGGKYKDKGMVPFTGTLTAEQVDAIHSFVIARGQEDWQPVFIAPPPRR